MPFCDICGAEVSKRSKFCPNCGADLRTHISPTTVASAPSKPPRVRTPLPLTLITSIDFGIGSLTTVLGFLILTILPKLSALGLGFGLTLVILGVLALATGFALWNKLHWAHWTARILGAGYIGLGLLLAITPGAVLLLLGVLAVLLGVFSIVMWSLKQTKRYLPS